eukprot:NODE_469_length_7049_cov_0.468489.p6 type:complete len:194 gc:universal NODE_469_length_7049_cov_0.468489:1735-2316(+)
MKLVIFSKSFDIEFMGTKSACLRVLESKSIDGEGVWVRKGVVLLEDDIIFENDVIYLIPKKSRNDSAFIEEPLKDNIRTPVRNLENRPPRQANRQFLSFGFRLILAIWIFLHSWDDAFFYFISGTLAYIIYNYSNLSISIGQPTGRLSSVYNIILSFIGTLIPGLMEIDPARLLMQMQNAQMEANRIEIANQQ